MVWMTYNRSWYARRVMCGHGVVVPSHAFDWDWNRTFQAFQYLWRTFHRTNLEEHRCKSCRWGMAIHSPRRIAVKSSIRDIKCQAWFRKHLLAGHTISSSNREFLEKFRIGPFTQHGVKPSHRLLYTVVRWGYPPNKINTLSRTGGGLLTIR